MGAIQLNEVSCDLIRAIKWENGRLELIDQRLPGKFEHFYLNHLPESAKAITDTVARGALSIGVTAAYAVVRVARDRYMEIRQLAEGHTGEFELAGRTYIKPSSRARGGVAVR